MPLSPVQEHQWDSEWEAALKERRSDDDHFHGAWDRSSGGRGAPSTASQKRKLGSSPEERALQTAATWVNRQDRQFRAAGGTIAEVTADTGIPEAREKLIAMQSKLGDKWQLEKGTRFTDMALNGGSNGDRSQGRTFVAYDQHGGVAGAVFVKERGYKSGAGFTGDLVSLQDSGRIEFDVIGTTGIAPGTGSALLKHVVKEYEGEGLGVVGDAVAQATPWWNKVTGGQIPNINDKGAGWGHDASFDNKMLDAFAQALGS